MAQKGKEIELEVEQFDNGITLRWNDLEGEYPPFANVVLEGQEAETIGRIVFEDIQKIMDAVPCNIVSLHIQYTPIELTE